MQNKRRLPPQLEPLQGIGLGAKKNGKTKGSKRTNTSEPTATTYHVNWMRGDHVITPLANSDEVDKAISSWTLKHLRYVPNYDHDKAHDLLLLVHNALRYTMSVLASSNACDISLHICISEFNLVVYNRTSMYCRHPVVVEYTGTEY